MAISPVVPEKIFKLLLKGAPSGVPVVLLSQKSMFEVPGTHRSNVQILVGIVPVVSEMIFKGV